MRCAVLLLLFGLVSLSALAVLGGDDGGESCLCADGKTTRSCNNWWDIDADCQRKCCKSSGSCGSYSCPDTCGSPTDPQECDATCQQQVVCKHWQSWCITPTCFGTVQCVAGTACGGFQAGDVCIYQPNNPCFKVCAPPPAPSTGSSVVGDPQFVGLRGQNFQIHGVSGHIYNIVSDNDLQYNSRFVFLDQGECPTINGKKQKGCWSHPGSYLGELGLKTKSGEKLRVVTGAAKIGFETIELNDKPLAVGDSVLLADNMGSVSFNNTHTISVQVGNWDFVFENSDMFLNQKVRVLSPAKLRSHGLLGQTWRETTYPNTIKYIQGTVDDYAIRTGDLFGDEFLYNAHN